MDKDIQIVKTVFNSTEFKKVIDTSFRTFTQPPPEVDLDTSEELFRLYEKLYFTLDITGPTNSHEYLAQKSSELLNFDTVTEDIQPLLDEIAQLRQTNLTLNQQILTLQTGIA